MTHALDIQVWSDVACPWCYVGKRRLTRALEALPPDTQAHVTWRAFELDPRAPRARPAGESYAARLARKYGQSTSQAEAMIERMVGVARSEGIEMHFDRIQSGNTFDTHRLLAFARAHDPSGLLQSNLKERLFRGYFTEGRAIGEVEALVQLAEDAGIAAGEAREVLESEAHADTVRNDEDEARELGITGVPFFVIDGRFAIPGAQPANVIQSAIGRALQS